MDGLTRTDLRAQRDAARSTAKRQADEIRRLQEALDRAPIRRRDLYLAAGLASLVTVRVTGTEWDPSPEEAVNHARKIADLMEAAEAGEGEE